MSGVKGSEIPQIFTKSDDEIRKLLIVRLQSMLMHLQGLSAQTLVRNVNVILSTLVRVNTDYALVTVYQNELILRRLQRMIDILSEDRHS